MVRRIAYVVERNLIDVVGKVDHVSMAPLQRPYRIVEIPYLLADSYAVVKAIVLAGDGIEKSRFAVAHDAALHNEIKMRITPRAAREPGFKHQ